ncbi:MAG: amidohydrolase family protein [Bryobacterales bacterium]
MLRRFYPIAGCVLLTAILLAAQSLTVEQYEPKSTLIVPERLVPRAKYPVIDVHSHHRNVSPDRLNQILGEMDALNLRVLINLSGGSGAGLKSMVDSMKGRHPKRFGVFANIDFDGIGNADWGRKAAAQLEADVQNGAQGLKFFKNFGLSVKYPDGKRAPVDDPALNPIFEACARLGIPVLIHVGDPGPFFEPVDRFNERWLELTTLPNRRHPPPPTFEELNSERDRLIARHPKVNFIVAHLGWHGNDLGRLGKLMDKYPNFHTEVGAVLAELGRQPVTGREFMIRYQDRVLFGKDSYEPGEYPYYWRVFETRDEYFEYYRRRHAHWRLYGLDLPDDVLKKVYYKNALRLIPKIDSDGFPP